MAYQGYECLRVRIEAGVCFATIDHPPINLFDLELMQEIDRLGREVEADDDVRVIVFDSADPEFFIAHADVSLIQRLPDDVAAPSDTLSFFHTMVDRFRTMPKISIAKIEGRARGGGSELALSLDMRFAAIGKAVLAQPEVALGIIPGGSGTQRLPRLCGRGRALEIVLGCQDFGAEMAERYGLVNRALAANEIGPFVDLLARRIATFPAAALALAKHCVNSVEAGVVEGLLDEAHAFNRTLPTPEAKRRMADFLAKGGQTRELESGDMGILAELLDNER
ncbi:MAG TPA: enoyl-CoA hydratase/isomerase family protein [Candidatus Binatia bacterium]|nr:enoyl-CoA hydratase/isomerase family protein [Candidatus Binatia bacterium]